MTGYVFVQSDLKVITDAKGGSFYRDHLPLLGMIVLFLYLLKYLLNGDCHSL